MKVIKIPCEHDLLSKNHNVWADAVIREKVAPFLTKRSVQRCIQGLVCAGYLREKKSGGDESRYFLTEKSKQLFGVSNATH